MIHSGLKRALSLVALVLAGCGGQLDAPPARRMPRVAAPAPPAAAADYHGTAHLLYLAHFGRPGDAAGLAYFGLKLQAADAPADPKELAHRYAGNTALRLVVETFIESVEGESNRSADDSAFVGGLYLNLFNRAPDAAGQAFWTALVANGVLTRGQAAVVIAASAQGTDAALLEKKLQMAQTFSAALDDERKRASYSGRSAVARLRATMADISPATSQSELEALASKAIAELGAAVSTEMYGDVRQVLVQRCVACHSVAPTFAGFSTAPLGIRYDTDEQIISDMRRIYINVAVTHFMPYGNRTAMTAAERELIRNWYTAAGRATSASGTGS